MKYSSKNKPMQCMMTQSTCYKGTRKMDIKGILIHSTGANNPNLCRYVQPDDNAANRQTLLNKLGRNSNGNDWNHIYVEAGLNAWIGKLADGTVTTVQTMPWDYRPWGCGSGRNGSCNNGWIQFEICEDGLTDKTYFNKIYQETVELCAYLCTLYKLDPMAWTTCGSTKCPVIVCHGDSYELGLGSGHVDINHWFPKFGKSTHTVREDVAALMKKSSTSSTAQTTPAVVKTYKVVTAINKYSNAADAKAKKNAKTDKLAAGTYYIYNKYPTGVDGMYNISTDKTGNSAGCWINPAENVIKESAPAVPKLYRVRKTFADAASQKGAFSENNLAGAKECCQAAGAGYKVFDWNGKEVYAYKAPVTLTSIAVTKAPTKGTYIIGESYDGSGLVVTATYSDKSTKAVTGYKVSGFNSAKAGTVTVTVTFEGKTATFKVTIKEKEVVVEPEKTVAVYDLDYKEKNKIVETVTRTNEDCTKAIKKILSNNNDFDANIAKAFFNIAPIYGIDPMMAIAQSILETGWFKFEGSSVKATQHNYCGLGATGGGVAGASFETIEDGVRAQLQHLFAYGSKAALPAGEKELDPRFKYVTRGIATYWQQLAGRWAVPGYDTKTYSTPQKAMEAGSTYGQKIRTIYGQLIAVSVTEADVNKYFVKEEIEETKPVPPVNSGKEETEVAPEIDHETDVTKPEANNSELVENMNFFFSFFKKLIEWIAKFFKGDTE